MKLSRKASLAIIAVVLAIVAIGVGFYLRPVSYFNSFLNLQMRLAGARSNYVQVNGIRIHYWVRGPQDGAPLVLVHGLGGRAEDWRNLDPYLVSAGFRVYTPDLPGFGSSDKPKDFSYSIPDQANIIVGFLDTVGLKQVDLGGNSMGGWIVQRVAFEHPDRVARLMLFDSAGLHHQPDWDTALFFPTTPGELNKLDALLMPDPPQVPPFIARDILRISNESWQGRRAMDSMLAGRDVTDSQLPELKMPVLIVWGDQDHITPLVDGQKMHQLTPQSQLDVVKGCGHLAPVQCADRIGPVVAGFLKR